MLYHVAVDFEEFLFVFLWVAIFDYSGEEITLIGFTRK
jgi:hypothetical protein